MSFSKRNPLELKFSSLRKREKISLLIKGAAGWLSRSKADTLQNQPRSSDFHFTLREELLTFLSGNTELDLNINSRSHHTIELLFI